MESLTLDQIAHSSRFIKVSALAKLFLTLVLLFSSLLSKSFLVPLIVFAIGLVLLFISNSFRLPSILFAIYLNTFIILLLGVLVIAFTGSGQVVWQSEFLGHALDLRTEALNTALLVLSRGLAGFSVLIFFATSTTIPQLFQALRQLGLPGYLAELTVLVYRYSFLFVEQLLVVHSAASCRMGFRDSRTSLRTLGMILSGMFIRCMDMADRAQNALLCRNFRGEFPLYRLPAPLRPEWFFGILLLLALLIALGQIEIKVF